MALDATKLVLFAAARVDIGGTLHSKASWAYFTADAATVVDTSGYFNGAADVLKVGDMIFSTTAIGGTEAYGVFMVVSNNGTVVDVANITAFGAANSD